MMTAALPRLRSFIFLSLLVAGWALFTSTAHAQGAPPLPGSIRDSRSLEVPNFTVRREAAVGTAEWVQGDTALHLSGDLNFLTPGARGRTPLVVLRSRGMQLVAGQQMLMGATPFHDLTSMRGLRASG